MANDVKQRVGIAFIIGTLCKKYVTRLMAMPPTTHCLSTSRYLLYFRLPNLLSSISTVLPGLHLAVAFP